MNLKMTKYYDSKGEITSKEAHLKEYEEFIKFREEKYQKHLFEIISQIPEFLGESQKVAFLYQHLTDNLEYDYEVLNRVDENGYAGPNSYPIWNKWGLGSHEKYAPIILKKGSSSGFAAAFCELCVSLNINCEIIKGLTEEEPQTKTILKHFWNVVEIDGKKGHVDISAGIFNRDKGLNRDDFFFLNNEELKEKGPHHNFNEELVKTEKLIN